MTTVRDILDFLTGSDQLNQPSLRPDQGTIEVLGVAPEDVAAPGDASWLSSGRLKQAPERVQEFGGALLLAPEVVGLVPSNSGLVVGCRSPKLAFSHVINRFFPDLLAWPWPPPGEDRHATVVVAPDVRLAPGVVLGRGVHLAEGVEVGPFSVLAHTTVGPRTRIGAHCSIGLSGFGFERDEAGQWFRFPHVGGVDIGESVEVGSNTCIDRGSLGRTRIERGAKIDNLVHIAHNVVVGADSLVIAHSMVAGSVRLGEGVWVAPSVAVLNQVRVGDGAVIGLGAVVIRDVAPGTTVVGNPARALEPRRTDAG